VSNCFRNVQPIIITSLYKQDR